MNTLYKNSSNNHLLRASYVPGTLLASSRTFLLNLILQPPSEEGNTVSTLERREFASPEREARRLPLLHRRLLRGPRRPLGSFVTATHAGSQELRSPHGDSPAWGPQPLQPEARSPAARGPQPGSPGPPPKPALEEPPKLRGPRSSSRSGRRQGAHEPGRNRGLYDLGFPQRWPCFYGNETM